MSTIGAVHAARQPGGIELVADETSSATAVAIELDQNRIEADEEIQAAMRALKVRRPFRRDLS